MKHIKYLVCIFLLLAFLSPKVKAQQDKTADVYNGNVRDKNGDPLKGATIEIQEKNTATVTDANGNFVIEANPGDIIIIKSLSFNTQQHIAGDLKDINITLQLSKIGGGENDNVVLPFAVRKQREVSAAVSVLKADDIPQLPVGGFDNLLAGRVAGLYVRQSGTKPGAEGAGIRIRGASTYNAGNEPMAIIDGIFRDISNIDLNEVETFTVLKDASTLSWYGLRGANGIIMLTTKRGNANKSLINFTSQYGIQQGEKLGLSLNSYDYARLYNEALTNIGQPVRFSTEDLQGYQSGADPYRYPNNNYVDDFIKTSAPAQRHVLSASGGSNTIKYFIHGSYLQQDGLFKNTQGEGYDAQLKFKRLNFRSNLDVDITKSLSVGLYAAGRTENRIEPGNGNGSNEVTNILNNLYNLPPNAFPLINRDGSLGGTSNFLDNPIGRLSRSGNRRDILRGIMATLNVKQKLDFVLPGLSANLLYGYDAVGYYNTGFIQNYNVYDFNLSTPARYRDIPTTNVGYRATGFYGNNRRNDIWIGLDYDKVFAENHQVSLSVRGQRSLDNDATRLEFRNQQVSAKAEYLYKDKYLASFVSSYAGSENFAPENRYGFFPAGSLGWIVSEEDFLKDNDFISYLKLRSSYGITGNGAIGGSRLPFRTLYSRSGAGGGYGFGPSFTATTSASESTIGNPDITWEESRMFNIGTDFKIFKQALSFSADYFNEERTNILTQNSIPSILGISLPQVNGGIVQSKGFDGSISYFKTIGDFNINLNANYTYADNKIIRRNEDEGILPYQSEIGLNVGSVVNAGKRFFVSDGLFSSVEEINSSPTQMLAGQVVPGDIKYKDINNDGVINNLDAINTNYTDIPSSYYGFGFNIFYKMFDISAQLQGINGRTMTIAPLINSGPDKLNIYSLDRWTPETAEAAKWPRLAISDRGNNDAASDFWLRSADYLKLKTAEIGYTFPVAMLAKLHVQKARIFVGGFNLFTISKLQREFGIDPELNYAGYGNTYPNTRTYTLGLNVQF
jgi:TonB-linked SusC/RagA family outer membrane protein